MRLRLTFEIALQADYHVSDGQRIGLSVDSALLRDHNEVPVLRGTTLVGLLADGYDDLKADLTASPLAPAFGLDEARQRLFGEPGQRKRWAFSSTSLAGDDKPRTARWDAQDVTRVRINPRTRRAAPQQLFVEEEGDARLRFRFTVTCHGATAQDRADALILVAAARMVRHLGAARRRGRGHCRINLVAVDGLALTSAEASVQTAVLALFRDVWLDGKRLPDAPKTAASPDLGTVAAQDAVRLRVIARLQEPVIVARKSEVANAFETLRTIPGRVILGALASRAAVNLNLDGSEADHRLFTRLFLRGDVRATGLLPSATDGDVLVPAVPAPQSLVQCENYPHYADKQAGIAHAVVDRLVSPDVRACQDPIGNQQGVCRGKLKKVPGFVRQAGHQGQSKLTVQTRDEIHIQMRRETGRANEGDLFTYHAIEAGQWFVGELHCAPGAWSALQRLTGLQMRERCELRLGKATRRGYGLTHLVLEAIPEADPASWVLADVTQRLPETAVGEAVELSMLLLTDAILVDTWGRYRRTLDDGSLAELLGVPAGHIEEVRPFTRSRIVDSFNTHRQIPGWRDEALEAGAVVGFSIRGLDRETLLQTLRRVEREGIGLQRHEGFGQVAFNHPVLTETAVAGIPFDTERMQLTPQPVDAHTLYAAHVFQAEWQGVLEDSMADEAATWRTFGEPYEALARLLFLYRYRPLAQLQTWLATKNGAPSQLGQPTTLWQGKPLVGRDKTPRVGGAGLKLVMELLDKLATQRAAHQAVGVEMLAALLGEQATHNREGGDAA